MWLERLLILLLATQGTLYFLPEKLEKQRWPPSPLNAEFCPTSAEKFKFLKSPESFSGSPQIFLPNILLSFHVLQAQAHSSAEDRTAQHAAAAPHCAVSVSGKWTWHYFPSRNHQFTHLFFAAADIISHDAVCSHMTL